MTTECVLTLSCPDRPGIVHAVAGVLAEHGGNITESQQFGDPASGLFFMRVQVALDVEEPAARAALTAAIAPVAELFGMTWELDVVGRRLRTLVLVSKAPHCLVDLLYRERYQGMPVDVVGVVGNHPDLADMAAFYGKPFHHVPVTKDTKAQAEDRLRELVAELDVELVVLARYMQILSDELCRDLEGKVINIHHSFLPS
ncbi:MAG TPA: formyltetrahydrofolate deformylase, partial [Luteimicrobium sp.]|nr:formyltetrahydrofolate deformylase [Luteimicrobium sp.]